MKAHELIAKVGDGIQEDPNLLKPLLDNTLNRVFFRYVLISHVYWPDTYLIK